MEGNKRSFFKKPSNTQFKRKGGNRKEKWNNSSHEQSLADSHSSDTVYRILCHSRKIGSVIGKGGSIVKALRVETQAKITVADNVPGSEERVIIIYSSSKKIPRKHSTEINDEDLAAEKEDDLMEPHCAAQVALLKVHDRIIEEDIFGVDNEDGNDNVVTARLLVPNNMVGCLLGKKGDVIQRLRSETGANIRVLPADHIPVCAMSTDELVQISGKPAVARRALFEVSTLLHQNPRKDQPPSGFPMPYGNQGFRPPGPPMGNIPPPGNPMWSQRNANSHGMPATPWIGGFGDEPSGFGPGGFDGVPGGHGGEAPCEFFMKILCSAAKIGGVIGKGGFNVKQVQQETGASIHVEDVSAESDERVIRVSSSEAPWTQRSQTIDAILQLQNKTSEFSDKGTITTRLLVPTSKVGCILGQGGHVINEMRRRTQADIRVYSKEDKPKCAAEDEELVQISGNFGVAKEALAEIASRLRARCLRDAKALGEPAPIGPHTGYGHPGNIHGGGPPPSGATGVGSSGGYNHFKGRGREYEPPNYPVHPNATGYPNVNRAMEVKMPNNAIGTAMGRGRSNASDIAGARVKFQDPISGSSEEIHGSSQHLNNPQSMHHTFMASGGQNNNPQHGSYQDFNARAQNYNPQRGSYLDFNSHSQHNNPHPQHGAYEDFSASGQNKNPQRGSYPDFNSHNQHNNPHPQHGAYEDFSASGQNNNPQHGSYHDFNAQQPSYPNINASKAPYQSVTPQQATYQNYQNVSTPQAPYQNNISAQSFYQY